MKKCLLLCVLCLIVFTGCSRRYMVTLQSGNQITAHGKPKLVNDAYVFKDGKGEERSVPRARVREIAPVSQASPRFSTGNSATPFK